MSPVEFDHQLQKRLLKFRMVLNRSAQRMNHTGAALQRAATDARKTELRLAASTNRLANCMRENNL